MANGDAIAAEEDAAPVAPLSPPPARGAAVRPTARAQTAAAAAAEPPHEPKPVRAIASFALPMLATLAADPLASLVDVAFVGRLGAPQLGGVGVAMSIFNALTKMFNASLLAVTTSQVAAASAAAAAAAAVANETAAAAAAAAAIVRGDEDSDGGDDAGAGGGARATKDQQSLHAAKCAKGSSEDGVDDDDNDDIGASRDGGGAASSSGGSCSSLASSSPDAVVVVRPFESVAKQQQQQQWRHKGIDVQPKRATDTSAAAAAAAATPAATTHARADAPAAVSAAASSALALALAFGAFESVMVVASAPRAVDAWGAPAGSALRRPALDFLTVRGAAAPVTVLLLVLQGVFRGLKDASTPLFATLLANGLNIAMEAPFIFAPLHLGVRGSALATVLAQAVPVAALLYVLSARRRVALGASRVDWRHLGAIFRPTGYLVLRSACVSAVFAAATALASRAGPAAAAAHQVALQVWLSSSLLADALAVAAQTLVAAELVRGRLQFARALARAALGLGAVLGCLLAGALALGARTVPKLFTDDARVLGLLRPLMLVVALTQPLNSLAFVLDGVLYGCGGFRYAAVMMLPCAAGALGVMVGGAWWAGRGSGGSGSGGDAGTGAGAGVEQEHVLLWVWAGLVALMALRAAFIAAPLLLRAYPLQALYVGARRPRLRRPAWPWPWALRVREAGRGRAPGGGGDDLEAPLIDGSSGGRGEAEDAAGAIRTVCNPLRLPSDGGPVPFGDDCSDSDDDSDSEDSPCSSDTECDDDGAWGGGGSAQSRARAAAGPSWERLPRIAGLGSFFMHFPRGK